MSWVIFPQNLEIGISVRRQYEGSVLGHLEQPQISDEGFTVGKINGFPSWRRKSACWRVTVT